jgi:hypothetical protein
MNLVNTSRVFARNTGEDATGFEAKGYAGIAGYLIQTDGDIKTEELSRFPIVAA